MGVPAFSRFMVRTDVANGVARLAVVGELDMQCAPALQQHLEQAIGDGADAALLDLRDLTFMDAAGLHVLLWASDRAQQNGHRMAIVGVGGEPRRVLQITETDGRLIDEAEGMDLIRRFTRADETTGDASLVEVGDGPDG